MEIGGYRFAPPSLRAEMQKTGTSLSESATMTETIDVPGELRLSNPIPPPVSVRLPLVAWPHGLKNVLVGLLALPSGALFAFAFAAIVFGTHGMSLSVLDCFVFLVVLPLSLFAGVSFTGAALTCFSDVLRTAPVLEIAADGLRDLRSGLSVRWSSVQCARILYNQGGIGGVDLQLRSPVTNWQNPFRIGVLFHRYRPIPDHVIVSVAYLDAPAHVLSYTILTLTEQNGGEAMSKTPGGFDMGLKL